MDIAQSCTQQIFIKRAKRLERIVRSNTGRLQTIIVSTFVVMIGDLKLDRLDALATEFMSIHASGLAAGFLANLYHFHERFQAIDNQLAC